MTTEMIVFDKIDNPLAFIEQFGDAMGDSGMFGTSKKSAGRVLAMACLCERKNPIEIARTYHVIEGRLSMRADAMHAEFRKAGGKVKWLNTGDDGVEAKAVFSFEGEEYTLSYGMAEAEKAGRNKKGSNYDKDPGSMLRARLLSRAVRMLCPEIIAGYYTPEEIDRTDDDTEKPTAQDIQVRREALQQMQTSAPTVPTTTTVEPTETATTNAAVAIVDDPNVVDAEFVAADEKPEPEQEPEQTDEVPFDVSSPDVSRIKVDQRQQIAAICEELGSTKEAFAQSYANKHQKNWEEMSEEEADKTIASLTELANKKTAEKMAETT